MRNQSTPVVLPQSPVALTVMTPQGYRRHGLLRGIVVLLLSGPIGLLLYLRGSGAVGAIVGGIVLTLVIIAVLHML